jgi:hypothetical protein
MRTMVRHPSLVLVLLSAGTGCSGVVTQESGAEGGRPRFDASASPDAADVPFPPEPGSETHEAGPDSIHAPEGASDAMTLPETGAGAAPESGTADAMTEGGVPAGPTFANWPMPNPADAGLPNPARYDTSVAGIVRDEVTHLMWQQADAIDVASTMAQVAAYCADLRLGDYSDWRLPSRIEVWSLQDFYRGTPAIDPVFSVTMTGSGAGTDYPTPWTSTPGYGLYGVGSDPTNPQSVSMFNGEASSGANSVRCVRGSTAQPSPHYTVSNGTVLDNGTGLIWQQAFDPVPSLPNGVANYCTSLTLAGGGWRAPSVKELETLVDDTKYSPSLDTNAFQLPPNASTDMNDRIFYTGSAWNVVTGLDETWYVNFTDGTNGTGTNELATPITPSVNNLFQVRCVK